jgi:hypothetical protein
MNPRAASSAASPTGRQVGPTSQVPFLAPCARRRTRVSSIVSSSSASVVRTRDTRATPAGERLSVKRGWTNRRAGGAGSGISTSGSSAKRLRGSAKGTRSRSHGTLGGTNTSASPVQRQLTPPPRIRRATPEISRRSSGENRARHIAASAKEIHQKRYWVGRAESLIRRKDNAFHGLWRMSTLPQPLQNQHTRRLSNAPVDDGARASSSRREQ